MSFEEDRLLGLAAWRSVSAESAIAVGSSGNRTPRSIEYGYSDHAGFAVDDADVDDLGVEDLADLVPDQLVHRLHVEVLGEAALHAVDDRELGSPLVGLGQESLRLVEQPRVLEGHAEAGRERASSRRSRSEKACVRSRFWSEIRPRTSPPPRSGDEERGHRGLALDDGLDALFSVPDLEVVDHDGLRRSISRLVMADAPMVWRLVGESEPPSRSCTG